MHKETIIMIGAVCLIMFIIGYLNQGSIEDCTVKGHSYDYCNHLFNR